MNANAPTVDARRTVRAAAVVCLAAAVVVTVVFLAVGQPFAGGALASGLLIGTLNGAAAARLIALPVPFAATSLMRIITLSLVAVAVGLAFGVSRIWLVILGLGFAQFALAGSALRDSVRR